MRRPRDLTAAEWTLFDAVAKGAAFDCRTGDPGLDDPAFGASWPDSRSIRADVIRALCVGGRGIPAPDPRGISIAGVRIEGSLDLESVGVAVPLNLTACHFGERINCRDTKIRLLDLEGSFLGGGLDGTGATFDHLLLRHGLICHDVVRLVGARITGFLDCSGATLHCPDGDALVADYISVDGPVYLRAWVDGDTLHAPFVARGGVRFFSAKIGGLDCQGASLRHPTTKERPDAIALSAEGASIKGSAVLSSWVTPAGDLLAPFIATGTVNLFGAEIAGSLECTGATLEASERIALNAEGIAVGSSVYLMPAVAHHEVLRPFTALGEVRLFRARIGHALECTGAFENPGRTAINAEAISVKGPVFLRSLATADGALLSTFMAKGTVSLFDADIGGSLECDGATFEGANGFALQAEAASVNSAVLLRTLVVNDRYVYPFHAKGEVRLFSAKVGANVDCGGGSFEADQSLPDRVAFNADGISVKGRMLLRSWLTNSGDLLFLCRISGGLRLFGARIEGELECRGAEINGSASLEGASVGSLRDDGDSWPKNHPLELDGLTYQRFAGDAPTTSRLLAWLRRQPGFRMQPYEQLVRVLRAEGREEDAREIAIAKRSDLRKSGQLSLSGRLWNLVLGVLVGHGYRPGRTLWIAIVVVALGILVFGDAEDSCAIGPTGVDQVANPVRPPCWLLPDDYPRFSPIVYSLDVFLPIINLHQEDYWLPNGAPPTGWLAGLAPLASSLGIPAGSLYWIYMWLHIALGWILTTFIVAALSGLIKKD